MSVFDQSWDLLKASLYRGTAAPFGFPKQYPLNHYKGMQEAFSLTDPGFMTTEKDAARSYAYERHDTMGYHDEPPDVESSVPYILHYNTDALDDKSNIMSFRGSDSLKQSDLDTLFPHLKGIEMNPRPKKYYPNHVADRLENVDQLRELLTSYIIGLNSPDDIERPTRWESNIMGNKDVAKWGERIEDAIADQLGYSYIEYPDVLDHDTYYSLRRDPSLKLVARHMLGDRFRS